MGLSPRERITKARVALTRENPFFGYLVMYLKPIESQEIKTMGVDMEGNLYFSPKMVESLSDSELIGVLCHEILHLVFLHLIRGAKKDKEVYNWASDAVVNALLKRNNFSLPDWAILPNSNGDVEFLCNDGNRIVIKKCYEKTADEIYDILIKEMQNNGVSGLSGERIDEHKYANGNSCHGDKGKLTDTEREWTKRFQEALEYSRQRGQIPAGFERIFDKLHGNYLSWRQLLYKYITKQIPIDYSYRRPSKKSYALHTYLPFVKREGMNIVVTVDTSGSISNKEIGDALSEIIGIIKSFSGIKLTVIYGDAKVQKVLTFISPTVDEILKEKPVGGGGTDHRPIFEYIEKHYKDAQVIVAFTDMYTAFPSSCSIPTIWIAFDTSSVNNPPFGTIIKYNRGE